MVEHVGRAENHVSGLKAELRNSDDSDPCSVVGCLKGNLCLCVQVIFFLP
jgi:hypothetical protein